MQSWQSVVVCVAVTLVSQRALGHPRALEEESAPSLQKIKNGVNQGQRQDSIWIPIENTDGSERKYDRVPDEDSKKFARSTSQEERESRELLKNQEKNKEQQNSSAKDAKKEVDDKLGSVRADVGVPDGKEENKEDDDIARSKKSTDMRGLSFNASPTTTVCIQVRSDHRPSEVVCGTQVGENKKEDNTASSARYAYQPLPSQAYYNPMYAQREQIPLPFPPPQRQTLYMRATPQDIEPSRPSAATGQRPQQMMMPQQMPSQGSAMSPKAARGPYPLRRTQLEDDNSLKQSETPQPAIPVQPFRIYPQSPPASVVVHKQIYQAAPLPSFAANLIAPAPTPLRFNCALQPDGSQLLQPYGPSLYRNTPSSVLPGYIPMTEEMMVPGAPSARMAQGPSDSQALYYDLQGRAAQPDEMIGSPYEYAADPWMATAYVGEDGQIYKIDESRARSAYDDQMSQWEQSYLSGSSSRASMSTSMSTEELHSKYYQQQEQLRESTQKLHQLQDKLKDIEQRASVTEEEKKESKNPLPSPSLPKEPTAPVREPTTEISDEFKKPEQNKPAKRHSTRHLKRK